jgi:mycothiol system anti-sigma-R factor
MNSCDQHRANILLYLDNALTGQALEDFLAHLASCPNCSAELEEERALSSLLRKSRPLYSAPATLRSRVAAVAALEASASAGTPDLLRTARLEMFTRWLRDISQPAFGWRPLAAMVLVLVLGLVFIPDALQRVRAMSYVEVATETHRLYLNGDLPLQCRSGSPETVTAWFADKAPFHFQLPASQPALNGKPVYHLTGARLVSYKGSPIALVAYETPTEKISLLVASSKSAVVAGGYEVHSGGLTFHYRSGTSFEVITWTNHGLTYALVSSLSGSPEHSCMVCHQDMADHVAVELLHQ